MVLSGSFLANIRVLKINRGNATGLFNLLHRVPSTCEFSPFSIINHASVVSPSRPTTRRHFTYRTSVSSKDRSLRPKVKHYNLCIQKDIMSINSINCAELHTTRLSSRSSTVSSNDNNNSDKNLGELGEADKNDLDSLLETLFYEVCQYGSLTANLPFTTVIKPLNPHDYPDMNKVIVQLSYDTPEDADVSSHQLSQIAGLYNLDVTFDEDIANMNLTCDLIKGLDLSVTCTVHVPMKFGLSIKVSGEKDVYVEKMESDNIAIETHAGNCKLHNIKCGSLSVISQSGNIVCKSTLLGNTVIFTGSSGGISMNKIQGSSVTCKTELGPMSVKSLYSETATFKTDFGDIILGQCHGQLHILAESSQVNIDSLDGGLDAALQSGLVDVLLSRHDRVDIDMGTGDIKLSLPEGATTDFNLNCPKLNLHRNVDANFQETDLPHHKEGFIGRAGVSQINARTLSGNISLRLLDWIETTKLAFKKEE